MKIHELGGEFALIEEITAGFSKQNSNLIKGLGDDCAVLTCGDNRQLVSCDTLLENRHFRLDWSTPEQVGMKAIEVNVSDILACGGTPKSVMIALVLPKEIDVEIVKSLYQGMRKVCEHYKIDLIGGDTTCGKELCLNITILGEVESGEEKLRSHAQAGDLICVTGNLGSSQGGLEFLQKYKDPSMLKKIYPYLWRRHLEPRSRFEIYKEILPHAKAMIDVSDGLGSELKHLCQQSQCGAKIEIEKIPLHLETRLCAAALNQSPEKWALQGGEDYELLFTLKSEDFEKLPDDMKKNISIIGEITSDKRITGMNAQGDFVELTQGYNHFNA